MTLHTVIARARVAQEKLLIDACTVRRITGEPVFDPGTGTVVTPSEVVYSGRCRLLPDTSRATDETDVAETQIGKPDFTVRLPVDSDVIRGDIVLITACPYDPAAVGKEYVVRKAQNDGRQFARHAVVEEYVVPSESEGS